MSKSPESTAQATPESSENPNASQWDINVERGQEIVNNFKEKAKESAARFMEKAGTKAKEIAYGTIGKTAELFKRGKEAVIERANQARENKAARQTARAERREARATARTERSEQREVNAAQRAEEQAQRRAEASQTTQENREARRQINDSREQVETALKEVEDLQAEIDAEKRKLEEQERKARELADISRQKDEAFQKAIVGGAPESQVRKLRAEAMHAEADAEMSRSAVSETKEKIGKSSARMAELNREVNESLDTANAARERLDENARRAQERKAERRAARAEKFGDFRQSAKDRLASLAANTPRVMAKIGRATGRATRAVVTATIAGAKAFAGGLKNSYNNNGNTSTAEAVANS